MYMALKQNDKFQLSLIILEVMQLCKQPCCSWSSVRSKEKAFKFHQTMSSLSVFLKQVQLHLICALSEGLISRLLKVYPHPLFKDLKSMCSQIIFKNAKYVVDLIDFFFSFFFFAKSKVNSRTLSWDFLVSEDQSIPYLFKIDSTL